MTFVIVLDTVLENIKIQTMCEGILYGRNLDDGETIQILSCDANSGYTRVGRWIRGVSSEEEVGKRTATSSEHSTQNLTRSFVLAVDQDAQEAFVRGYVISPGNSPQSADVKLFRLQDIQSRLKGVIDPSFLGSKKVLILGLGSGGSRVALELAKSGVGKFILVDNERLDPENIARHVCGISDIGRFKTRAVKEMILNHNPKAVVDCYEIDVRKEIDLIAKLISGSDLVVAATGSPIINNMTNDLCVKARVAAVFAGAWERASGGYVMRYVPDSTPCFNCVHEFLLTMLPQNVGKAADYSIIDDLSELKSEPGLSVDIGFISLLQAKFSLLTLLRGTQQLEDVPYHMVIWLNREYGDYKSLTLLKANTTRRKDCAICNPKGWFESKIR